MCWWACNGNGFRLFIYPFSTFWMLFFFIPNAIEMAHCQKFTLFCFGFYWLWLKSLIFVLSTFDSLSIWIIFPIFSHVMYMYWDCNAKHMANFHFVCAYFHVAKCEWTVEQNIDTACKKGKRRSNRFTTATEISWSDRLNCGKIGIYK